MKSLVVIGAGNKWSPEKGRQDFRRRVVVFGEGTTIVRVVVLRGLLVTECGGGMSSPEVIQ